MVFLRLFLNIRRLHAAKIPGPFLASVTDLWRNWIMQRCSFPDDLNRLHGKYGKLVRLGPSYVSVADAAALPIIYGTSPILSKACLSKSGIDLDVLTLF
jgi:hypothetical protein